jgi:predicted  nucleic acid-binding Zn-ribbon protein
MYFFHVFVFLRFRYVSLRFCYLDFVFFTVFEENTQKLSSSELASFQKTYDLKASIVGKVISERLLENDEIIKKLSGKSEKLKHDLDKAHTSSAELEQRISELVDSLKKCQDEKNVTEAALQDSQRDMEKLKKTHEDNLNLIENFRQDSDRNAKTIDELCASKTELSTRNSDLAKALNKKEQKIQDLEKALFELSETSRQEIDRIKKKLKLLFEEYRKVLRDFDVRPGPLPKSEEISNLMCWIETEFKAPPDVISGASDFAAAFSVESILKLLHDFDCADLAKFREKLSCFPDVESTSIIRPNEDVQSIKIKFAREFWFVSGKELAKKIAHAKLDQVIVRQALPTFFIS